MSKKKAKEFWEKNKGKIIVASVVGGSIIVFAIGRRCGIEWAKGKCWCPKGTSAFSLNTISTGIPLSDAGQIGELMKQLSKDDVLPLTDDMLIKKATLFIETAKK